MKIIKTAKAWEWEAHFYRAPLQAHAVLGPIIETGSSLSRVYDHTKNNNIGCITAWRGGKKANEEQRRLNNQNFKELKTAIRNAGFGYIKIKGRYIENKGTELEENVDEEVALIVGDSTEEGKKKLKTLLIKWGAKYEQDSVLFKGYDDKQAHLIYTSGKDKGKVETVGTWHPNKIGDFFSVMKNGSTFVFAQ